MVLGDGAVAGGRGRWAVADRSAGNPGRL